MSRILLILICLSGLACHKTIPQKEYRISGSMELDGYHRTYIVDLPPNFYDSSGFALVIALHGYGGSADEMERDYGITEKALSEKFIVVYPDGVPATGSLLIRSWNTGTCCANAQEQQIDDVHFIRQLIDKMTAAYKVDARRVYVTGMSNGAMMSYTLACKLSDKIAAAAPVSGTLMISEPCEPSRPVPIIHIHSKRDTKVPYAGGPGLGGLRFTAVDSALRVWAAHDGAATEPLVQDKGKYLFKEWKGADGKTVVDLYLTNDGGHSWPGGNKPTALSDAPSTAFDATDLIWEFFQRYRLP